MKQMNRQEMEQAALQKITAARAQIMMSGKRKFWAVLLANTTPKACWTIDTMATDSKTHYFNPAFICGMTMEETIGVVVHEAEHDARHHSTRRKNREPKKWNKACDYTINPDILREGFKLPNIGILNRDDLAGLSAEMIYRVLDQEEQAEKEKQRKEQEEQEKQQQQSDDDEDGEGSDESEPSDDGDDDDSEGDDADESSDPDQDQDDGEGDNSTVPQDDDSDDDGDDADDDSDGDADGEGDGTDSDANGEGEGEAGDGEAESDAGKPGTGDGEGESDGEGDAEQGPVGCGEGGLGEVLDAPGDEAETADQDAKWEVITRQAAALAKKAGVMPGHWTVELENRQTPTEDWRAILQEFFAAGAQTIQTFNRPNKRFAWSGTILPGNQREGVQKVAFLVDTSGSMLAHLRNAAVANEVKAAMELGVISEVLVIHCDTAIHQVDRYVAGEELSFEPKGLGGTDMTPGFQWIEDNEPDTNLIVTLTDMFIGDCPPEPVQPVLWCAFGDPRYLAEYRTKPTYGRVIDITED